MRTALIIAATAGLLASITPAAAQDYPWCRWGNHDCMYQSFAQCMAALSGTAGDCRLNPALQARTEPLQAYGAMPHRHHHRHYRRHHHHRHG